MMMEDDGDRVLGGGGVIMDEPPSNARRRADQHLRKHGVQPQRAVRFERQQHEPLPKLYRVYLGVVKSVKPFGGFVELDGFTHEGLLHVSQLSKFRVDDVESVLQVGQQVFVKVIEVGEPPEHRIALSIKTVDQRNGHDSDPAHVIAEQDKLKNRSFRDDEVKRVQLDAVLNTVCTKCHTPGHLAKDCFNTGKAYALVTEDEVANVAPPASSEGHAKKHKKDKHKKDKKESRHKKHHSKDHDAHEPRDTDHHHHHHHHHSHHRHRDSSRDHHDHGSHDQDREHRDDRDRGHRDDRDRGHRDDRDRGHRDDWDRGHRDDRDRGHRDDRDRGHRNDDRGREYRSHRAGHEAPHSYHRSPSLDRGSRSKRSDRDRDERR
ncbi:uncharacterized protein MONBRDRAFT_9127 [Monosiga brevicollis MX1]|uniref:S1 motif domain-containing protein n=1 Tax=Monosiga brevicollis TaxID=81824 RepID=A9V260_MONBE|nr:uncharacterized protein MONBRDRAFT_9127 [Monosiga brevicollis MX1]EDQ88323.1 predicted protein [Monosiga brevicollis MX1]|eukprot:XP_001746916.1 hypothetical protein [Monosiga brevicollis MX1]